MTSTSSHLLEPGVGPQRLDVHHAQPIASISVAVEIPPQPRPCLSVVVSSGVGLTSAALCAPRARHPFQSPLGTRSFWGLSLEEGTTRSAGEPGQPEPSEEDFEMYPTTPPPRASARRPPGRCAVQKANYMEIPGAPSAQPSQSTSLTSEVLNSAIKTMRMSRGARLLAGSRAAAFVSMPRGFAPEPERIVRLPGLLLPPQRIVARNGRVPPMPHACTPVARAKLRVDNILDKVVVNSEEVEGALPRDWLAATMSDDEFEKWFLRLRDATRERVVHAVNHIDSILAFVDPEAAACDPDPYGGEGSAAARAAGDIFKTLSTWEPLLAVVVTEAISSSSLAIACMASSQAAQVEGSTRAESQKRVVRLRANAAVANRLLSADFRCDDLLDKRNSPALIVPALYGLMYTLRELASIMPHASVEMGSTDL